MIDKKQIENILKDILEKKNFFLVEVKISKSNDIDITFDSSDRTIDLDDCVEISRYVESGLDRDKEDFSLTVGSAGLTTPFKVPMQYLKNIGKEVDIFFRSGKKLSGTLKSFSQGMVELCYKVTESVDGKKKKVTQEICESFDLKDVNKTILKI